MFDFSPKALVTTQDVEMWLGVDSTTIELVEKAKIEFLVNTACEAIQDYCGRIFSVQEYMEVMDGQESDLITTENYPITSITGIALLGQVIDTSYYYVRKDEGAILLKNCRTPRGRGTVEVVYSAGYTSIPYTLKQACLFQLQFLYNNYGGSSSLGFNSRSKMGESESKDKSIGENGLIGEVIGLVNRFKRMEAPNVSMFAMGS